MSKWEQIDWSIYLHQIEKTPTLLEACERYEKDLKNIISSNIESENKNQTISSFDIIGKQEMQ